MLSTWLTGVRCGVQEHMLANTQEMRKRQLPGCLLHTPVQQGATPSSLHSSTRQRIMRRNKRLRGQQ